MILAKVAIPTKASGKDTFNRKTYANNYDDDDDDDDDDVDDNESGVT